MFSHFYDCFFKLVLVLLWKSRFILEYTLYTIDKYLAYKGGLVSFCKLFINELGLYITSFFLCMLMCIAGTILVSIRAYGCPFSSLIVIIGIACFIVTE